MVISVAKASPPTPTHQLMFRSRVADAAPKIRMARLDSVGDRAKTNPMTKPARPSDRCFGTGDPLMERYHDEEWGRPVRDDEGLFERIALEGFQSGLSWATVLRKRENFRAAFAEWDARAIAAFGEGDVARLMSDAGIIRNRVKILSTITNARALVGLWDSGQTLTDLVWAHMPSPKRRGRLRSWADVPASTEESKALTKSLKSHGFVFVGPVTMYALMQACGLVDVHLDSCPARRR
jgi:DNA-3-methyladenine glycosylase I